MQTSIENQMTFKQRSFCNEYLKDRNATAAAIRAGYSKKTALDGYLMTIPKIKMFLRELDEQTAQKVQVDADMVLRELCKIAFGNMGNYFNAEGNMKPMHNLTDDEKAALWSVSVTDVGSGGKKAKEASDVIKFRMYNKLGALDKIAKCLNMYKPEIKEPEKHYMYAHKETLDKHDAYDDEDVTFVTEWDKDGEPLRREEDLAQEENTDEEYVPLDEDGNPLRDGAGIPYGKVRPVFMMNLAESPEQMLIRLKLYEAGDDTAATSETVNADLLADKPEIKPVETKPCAKNFISRNRAMREREEMGNNATPRVKYYDLRKKQ